MCGVFDREKKLFFLFIDCVIIVFKIRNKKKHCHSSYSINSPEKKIVAKPSVWKIYENIVNVFSVKIPYSVFVFLNYWNIADARRTSRLVVISEEIII